MSTVEDSSWVIDRWENESFVEDDGKKPVLPSQALNLVLPQVSDNLRVSGGPCWRHVNYHLVNRREIYCILYGILLKLSVMVRDRFQIAGVNFGGAFIMITRTCPTSTPHILMRMGLNRRLTWMTCWEECSASDRLSDSDRLAGTMTCTFLSLGCVDVLDFSCQPS